MDFKLSRPSLARRNIYGIEIAWRFFKLLSISLWVSTSTSAYNILTTDLDFVQQPNADLNNNTGPLFFGYDFALKPNGNKRGNVSIIVGSPKGGTLLDSWFIPTESISYDVDDNPLRPGDIFSCGISLESGASSCRSINPAAEIPDDPALMTDVDSSGLNIIKPNPKSNSGDMMICAPLRARNCTSDYLIQGACFASDDYGATWQSESKQATISCPVLLVDLIFVLDGSGSVISSDARNFDLVKEWVKTVASKFDLNDFAHVGVIQYSHWYKSRDEQPYIKTEIALGEFKTQREFEMQVDKIEIHGYTTYTAHAINKTVDDFMDSERFNDTATKKVMILLTDGTSNDVADLPVSAEYARSMGITIFSVGVADYSKKELQIISTGQVGNDQRVYGLQRFSDLQKIVGSLQKSITGILEGSASANVTNDLQNSETGIGGTIDRIDTCIKEYYIQMSPSTTKYTKFDPVFAE